VITIDLSKILKKRKVFRKVFEEKKSLKF